MTELHDLDQDLARRLAEANAEVPVPEGLVDRIERRLLARDRRRAWAWRAPLAAAAAVGLFVAGRAALEPGRPPGEPRQVRVLPEAEAPRPAGATRHRATVTFAPETALFARPISTEHPDVSIVFVYRHANLVHPAPDGPDTASSQGNES